MCDVCATLAIFYAISYHPCICRFSKKKKKKKKNGNDDEYGGGLAFEKREGPRGYTRIILMSNICILFMGYTWNVCFLISFFEMYGLRRMHVNVKIW